MLMEYGKPHLPPFVRLSHFIKIMKNSNSSSSGIGISGLLGVAFVILKLCNVINWSWWYVTMPFWLPFVIALVIMLLVLIFKKS